MWRLFYKALPIMIILESKIQNIKRSCSHYQEHEELADLFEKNPSSKKCWKSAI